MPDAKPQYLIGTVSKRTGVKPDLVRAWERRYQAVTPQRSDGRQRLYSDDDIVKLKLLHQATLQGHAISRVAKLSLPQLQKLLEIGEKESVPAPVSGDRQHICEDSLQKCIEAIERFDSFALEKHFENALLELGTLAFIESLLLPLLQRIGEYWQSGRLRPSHEHMASAIIRSMAYILRSNAPRNPDAQHMVIATPAGQVHELGALLASVIAEFRGWQVTYLGADLPAEEIALAVKYQAAKAVALSITFNDDSLNTTRELRKLQKLIAAETALIIGGRGASHYLALAGQGNVHVIGRGIQEYKELLDELG